jgi:DNA polymerase-3 subunit beta
MKLSCLQENLNKGLSLVGRAVATRTTLPITSNVLLATDNARLKLSATNLEIAISCWIGAKVEQEGALTVPARLLNEFVASLPADRIEIEVPPRSKQLALTCGRFEARMSGIDAEEFPPIPEVREGMVVRIAPEVLRRAIEQVAFSAATEDSRPVLTGTHLSFSESTLTMAAADGFRLAVHKAPLLEPVQGSIVVIVPAKSLLEMNRLQSDQQDPVELVVNTERSQLLCRLKNLEMVSQLIQGTFPNYQQLIPQSHTTRAVMDVQEFLRATKLASIFARDASGIVRLAFSPGDGPAAGKAIVSARAEETGENKTEIDAVIEGESAKIAFNSRYLTEILQVLGKGKVAVETTSPSSPGVFRPLDGDNYTHVVMPMFVQW